ncbi:MAG: hypothetical protein ACXAEU_17655 [Candidatus Hodarchaeales archaeon]
MSFIDLVDTFAGKKALIIDQDDQDCQTILNELETATNTFYNDYSGGKEFDISDNLRTKVPSFVQQELEKILKESTIFSNVESIVWAGYPRFLLKDRNGNYIHLTIKTTTRKATKTVRDIYFSKEGQKIENDGYHVAVLFLYYVESVEDLPVTHFENAQFFDLAKMYYKVKIEYQGLASTMKRERKVDF